MRYEDDVYHKIQSSEAGIADAARAYEVDDPQRIADILDTQAELEQCTVHELSIRQVYDAFRLATTPVSDDLRVRIIQLLDHS